MEKKYVIPTSQFINLNGESPLLVTSGEIDNSISKNGNNAMTRQENAIESPWDSWNE